MSKIEAGRLSASDLEHPDLQPLLLPLEAFHGKGSRLPGAVIKNPGGGKQKHWATCWVVKIKPKYTTASGEVRRRRSALPPPPPISQRSAHHLTASTPHRSPHHCAPLSTTFHHQHCVPTATLFTALPSAVAAGGSSRGVPSRPRRLVGLEGGRHSAHPLLRWHGNH